MPLIDESAPTGLQVTFEGGVLNILWTAASIPSGYTAVITVTDDQDRPLSPAPEIVISGAAATVAGPAIQPHTNLKVRLQALSPPAGPVTIELISLVAPAAPALHFGAAGLDIRWNSIEGASGYEVEVTDADGNRLDPQPAITHFGPDDAQHASIAGDSLLDQTTYQLRVRSTADRSRSLWSDVATIRIDKSYPESALLQALLARLQDASATFELGPDVIRSGRVTGQFASLLNAAAGTLAVRDASVSSTLTSVTLSATLDLFHVNGAIGVFVFSDQKSIVELNFSYPLGSCTILQLKTAGLLPADAFGDTAWADSLAVLEQVVLHLDTAADKVTLTTDDGAAWSILGLPSVALGAVKPQLEVYAPLNTRLKRYVPRVMTEIDLGSAGKIPVYVQLPAGYTPWQVGLTPPWYAGNVTGIYALFGGSDLSLPDGVVNLGQLTLDALTVTHIPNGSTWSWDLAVTLGPIPGDSSSRWQIIAGVLELERLSAALRVDVVSTSTGFVASSSGAVAARFTLGTDPLDAVLRVPGVGGKWTLSIATSRSIALAQTSQLLGGNTTALNTALARVGTTSGFTLEGLDVEFKPAVPELTQFSIAVTINTWTVPLLPWFSVDRISARLLVLNPLQAATRLITGTLEALLTLGSVQVGVVTSFDESSVWKLRIGSQAARLSRLSDLEGLVSADTISGQVPPGLPTSGGFEMGTFGFSYDSEAMYVTEIGFVLRSSLYWEIVADVFTLNDIDIEINGTKASASAPMNYTGRIAGRITLAGARFLLSASRPDVGTPWKLQGELEDRVTLDFNALLHEQVSSNLSIPTMNGFPTALTILSAEASLIPDTGAFDFSGDALVDWSFTFGAATFAVCSLGGSIHRDPDPEKSTGMLYGTFDFGSSLMGDASIQLGGGDTIIKVAVEVPSDPAKLNAATFADQLTGASANTSAQETVPFAQTIPGGLNTQLAGVAVSVNLTQGEYLLTGKVAGLWSYLFYRKKTQPEYLFAVGFGPDFTFKGLISTLEPVDSIIKVNDARMVVYNVVESTGLSGIQTAVTALENQDAVWPLPDVTGISLPPRNGLLISAQIQLNAPALFANVVQIGSMGNSTVRMLGVIDLGTTNNSFFAANLPDITLFSSVAFTGVLITFTPKDQKITVAASVVFPNIFEKRFGFSGGMTLDSDKMSGELSLLTTNHDTRVSEPFDIPGIVIDQLSLGVDYTFAKPAVDAQGGQPAQLAREKSSQFSLQGHVLFGRAPQQGEADDRISLVGKLALVDGAPALVYAAVDRTFSVGRFLAQCITGSGNRWPSTFIDLEFLEGTRIYYYSKTADPEDTLASYDLHALRGGYNIDACIRITLVDQMTLHAVIQVVQDDAGNYSGINAALDLDALDLGFIKLAGPTLPAPDAPAYTDGPQLCILTGDNSSFSVSTGVNFLGSAFGSVSVSISKPTDGQTQFDGVMTAAKEVAPFGLPSCSFTYIVRPGGNVLRINDWPNFQEWLGDFIHLVDAIKDLYNTAPGSTCGELANMIVQNAFHETFSLRPSVASHGEDLVFSLSGTYSLQISEASEPFLSMEFPPLDVHIPTTTTYDDLPGVLATGITNASARFARDLLGQPEKIAQFLAMVFAEEAATIALTLLCKGIVDAAVAAATEAAADALAAAGGALAAGAAGVVLAAIKKSRENSSSSHGGSGTSPQTPTLNTLVYRSNAIAARWSGAAYAAQYVFEVLDPSSTLLGEQLGLTLSGSVTVDAATLPVGTFQGRVKSTRGDQASEWSTKTIVKPAPPTLVLYFVGTSLNARWSDLSVDSYVVQFFDPQNNQLGSDQTITAAPLSGSVALPDPAAGAYTARGKSVKSDNIPGDWSASVSLEVLTLPAPTNLTLLYDAEKLTASWDTGTQSGLTYELVVRAGDTTVASTTSTAGSVELTPDGEQSYQDGTTYTVSARARDTNAMSPWSTGTITIAQLAAPAGLQVDIEGHALQAQWQAVPGAATYEAQALDSAGQPLAAQPPVTYAGATARVDASSLQEGQTYRVRVRAAAPQNLGAWCAAAILQYQPVLAPTNLNVRYEGVTIFASWNTIESAMGIIEVLEEQGQPLDPQPEIAVTPVGSATMIDEHGNTLTTGMIFTAQISGAGIVAGATFQLHVQARTQTARSDWSAPLTVHILPSPNGLQLSVRPNVIAAQWQAVTGAGGYEAQALDATGHTLPAQPLIQYDAVTAHFDSSALQNGAIYQLQVRALDLPNRGLWSAPASATASVHLAAPAGLTLHLGSDAVVARWQEVPGASAYTVLVLDSLDQPLNPQPEISMSAVPAAVGVDEHGNPVTSGTNTFIAQISGPGILAGAQIKVQVKGTSANSDGIFCSPVAITLSFLLPPTITGATMQGNSFVVTWEAVDGAASYNVLVFDAQGQQLDPQPPITYSGTTATVDSTNLPVGTYSFKVQTIVGSLVSAYSAPVSVVRAPSAPPAGLTAVYAADSVFASWQPYPGVNTFRLLVLDSQGRALQPQPDVSYSGTTATADASALAPGSYSVKLATAYLGKEGTYSDAIAFQILGGWMRATTTGPPMMINPVVLSYKGQLWAMAGQYSNTVYNSPDGRAWIQVSGGAPWVGRRNAAGVVYLGKMWLMGGESTSGDKNDVWWSEDGSNWTQTTSAAPWGPRFGLCAVVFQSRMWVFGGMDHDGNVYNDVWSSTDGVSWTQQTLTAAWSKRDSAAAAVFNGRVWIMGGLNDGNSIQDVWSTADGINWQQAATPPWASRFDACAAVVHGSLYLMGGINTQTRELFDTWVTTDATNWTQLQSSAPWTCGQMGAAAQDNVIYLLGGISFGRFSDVVWAYQPVLPIGVGYSPVLVSTVADLLSNLINLEVQTADLGFGQFSAGPSVLTATPDGGSYRIVLGLGNAQSIYTINNVVIGCSTVPLSEWRWNSFQTPAVASVWTSSGWTLLDFNSNQLSMAVPYRGLYFYRVLLKNVTVGQSPVAFLTSQNTAATVAFYTPLAHTAPSPIPASFAPVMVNSAAALINELFNVNADNPQLTYGRFSPVASTVTATPEVGYFKIFFELGGSPDVPYTVTNSVVACSDVPLSEWNWYGNAGSPTGTTSVWTGQGWQNVPATDLTSAAAFQGLYFYRIDLNNELVLGQLRTFLSSHRNPATIAFFTRVGSGSP